MLKLVREEGVLMPDGHAGSTFYNNSLSVSYVVCTTYTYGSTSSTLVVYEMEFIFKRLGHVTSLAKSKGDKVA